MENRQNRGKKRLVELLSIEIVVVSCLLIVSMFLFAAIMHEVVYEKEEAFDNRVFTFFAGFSTPGFIQAMKFFTFFGSSPFIFPSYVILISWYLIRKKFRYGLHLGIIALSSTGLMFALKEMTHRSRPNLPIIQGLTNFSFPSGHALSSFILCSILVYIVWHSRRLNLAWKWVYAILLMLFAVMVGISRIVLKVHYPTDVIASFCLGTAWVTMSFTLLRKIGKNEPALPRNEPDKTS
jgi:membrane-associated phospholipid phosphatase